MMENTTDNTFEVLMNWLIKQENTCTCNKSVFPDYIHYLLTRLHLQKHPKIKWIMNGDEHHVFRTLIYSINKSNVFCNIMKVLCNSPEIEDRILAIILNSSNNEFRQIDEKFINYFSDEQKVNMSMRLIKIIRNAE